jgi:hypothetical protein
MTVIGFTGSRQGMTPAQKAALRELLEERLPLELDHDDASFHHGDCVGADAEAHDIAAALDYLVTVHPPSDPRLRAAVHRTGKWFEGVDVLLPEKPYLERDRDIVDACDELIACPKDASRSGGTWHTVHCARRAGKPVTIIWPDGEVTADR